MLLACRKTAVKKPACTIIATNQPHDRLYCKSGSYFLEASRRCAQSVLCGNDCSSFSGFCPTLRLPSEHTRPCGSPICSALASAAARICKDGMEVPACHAPRKAPSMRTRERCTPTPILSAARCCKSTKRTGTSDLGSPSTPDPQIAAENIVSCASCAKAALLSTLMQFATGTLQERTQLKRRLCHCTLSLLGQRRRASPVQGRARRAEWAEWGERRGGERKEGSLGASTSTSEVPS